MDENFELGLPLEDDDLYVGGIEVVSYMTAEGEQEYRVRWDSNMNVPNALGLLELAKYQILNDFTDHEDCSENGE